MTKFIFLINFLGASLAFCSQELKLPHSSGTDTVSLKGEFLCLPGEDSKSSGEQELNDLASNYAKYSSAGNINDFSKLYDAPTRERMRVLANNPEMLAKWSSIAKKTKTARVVGWIEGADSAIRAAYILSNEKSDNQKMNILGIAMEEGKLKLSGITIDTNSDRFKILEWWSKYSEKAPEIVNGNKGTQSPSSSKESWIVWLIAVVVTVGLILLAIWKKSKK